MFEGLGFDKFDAIDTLTNYTFPTNWFSHLNDGKDEVYLAFSFYGHKYPIYTFSVNGGGCPQSIITKDAFKEAFLKMKEECEGATWGLVSKLEKQFVEYKLITILGVIYP